MSDTIVALSSGSLPSGVAVIRISGPLTSEILKQSVGKVPPERIVILSEVRDPSSQQPLDRGLVLFFKGPHSFTGEDCAELHVHGGRAVVNAVIDRLCAVDGVRLAEAGEFSRRAFENGKLDLTEVDGIADLVAAETEQQRLLALRQSQGTLRTLYDGWRERLVYIRSMIEAEFDFSDEEDVPEEISQEGFVALGKLAEEISRHLDDNKVGEILRDGFKIALMGKPNAGKSSLLNALAKRDVAIVTEQAGTTRDVLDVALDLKGYKVVLSDTAGIRDAEDVIEVEGIRRANARADECDLVIWLTVAGENEEPAYKGPTEIMQVFSKTDLADEPIPGISTKTGSGIPELLETLVLRVQDVSAASEEALITRQRYRTGLTDALGHIKKALVRDNTPGELVAEEVRLAGDCIGRITGRIDVEDLLDVIFANFCVGK